MAQYGGFWRRVAAYLIDAILLGIVTGILGAILGFGAMSQFDAFAKGTSGMIDAFSGVANLLDLVIGLAYFAGMESSSYQGTLGKQALGLVVTDGDGNRISLARGVGRYFAKYVSVFTFCIGFIMVAFTDRNRGLHDMLAGTLVHKGRPVFSGAHVFD